MIRHATISHDAAEERDHAHHRHQRMRWRESSHRRRRQRILFSCLLLLAALFCYWELLSACHPLIGR